MDISLAFRAIYALCVVGTLLFGLWFVARLVGRNKLTPGTSRRLVTVLDSTLLSQHTTLHVIRTTGRYFLVGGGNAGCSLITELSAQDVELWQQEQREAVDRQVATLDSFLKRLRGG